ncbi:surfactin synthase thioesterase subunit [Stackebrandtia endophytica]|uniref:Surfactin synthase thioesterase subunit n=1 Tax=Stackebrandtia endophytica TaxID=1496996 RepID=A0A543ARZ6_9ACTN|nr:alpha/beta fold hydrolase [Stackebrandtia endophytica]TQL75316.1 surfactin synthase thioesterase subunit [Stackebrandtia endophytica]
MIPAEVVVFPPAGSGPSFYAPLTETVHRLRVRAPDLPGKERRCTEPLPTTVEDIVDGCLADVVNVSDRVNVSDMAPNGPAELAVFGHCFGALLAFQTVLCLERVRPDLTVTLLVSGSPPPGELAWEPYSDAPPDRFVQAMEKVAGYLHPAVKDPDMRDFLLPLMRADVVAHERFRRPPTPSIGADIVALRGRDDSTVSADAARGWAADTTGSFRLVEPPGGHMYPLDSWDRLRSTVEEILCPDSPTT